MDEDSTRLPGESPRGSLLATGQQFGQYKVIRLLGRGGMGEVYEVEHTVLHRSYALKIIRPEVLNHPSAVERYRREKEELTLEAAGSQSLNFGTLVAESGDLELRITNSGLKDSEKLAWFIDGEKQSSDFKSQASSLTAGGTGLELGERQLRVVHPDYTVWTGSATIRDHQTSKVTVDLKPKPGVLELAVTPAGVSYSLTVDGQPVKQLSGNRYSVPAEVPLKLELKAQGYKTKLVKGQVAANGSETLPVRLEKITGPESGRDWTLSLVGGESIQLKWIAPGSFQMGSNDGDSDEKPVHRVTLTKGYWLGETELTQGQWQSMMSSNPSYFKGSNLPVEMVSWNDAIEFCRKLTERERAAGRLPAGLSYTLPTEAQWEYACRAGTTTRYSFGDSKRQLKEYANYEVTPRYGDKATAPVGSFKPNGWGLYDMHGNVYEWCLDWYDDYPSESVVDPSGASSGSFRVFRGGSLFNDARYCRSAIRFRYSPGYRFNYLGFRLALTINH